MLGLVPETMLPEKYRRLWSRRLRRRPLLPFLLAATLASVLATLPVQVENPTGAEVALLFVGGSVALFGLSGLWITSQPSGLIGRISLSAVVVLLVAFALYPLEEDYAAMATFGLLVTFIAAILGLVTRALCRESRRGLRKSPQRYTLRFLLVLTTFVIGAITLLQRVDVQVLQALTTDPTITGYLAAEAFMAPLWFAIASALRSTRVAAITLIIATTIALTALDFFLPTQQMPAIWLPPHYYHLGMSSMTALWILGTRKQSSRRVESTTAKPVDELQEGPIESINLTA